MFKVNNKTLDSEAYLETYQGSVMKRFCGNI